MHSRMRKMWLTLKRFSVCMRSLANIFQSGNVESKGIIQYSWIKIKSVIQIRVAFFLILKIISISWVLLICFRWEYLNQMSISIVISISLNRNAFKLLFYRDENHVHSLNNLKMCRPQNRVCMQVIVVEMRDISRRLQSIAPSSRATYNLIYTGKSTRFVNYLRNLRVVVALVRNDFELENCN